MNINLLIPSLSLGAQLISIYFAIRLMRYAEKRAIAVVFLLVISLMAFRRFIPLVRLFSQGDIQVDLFAETIAFIISILILYGMILIGRIFKSEEDHKNTSLAAETRYRALFDQSPDGILLIDTNGKVLEFNDMIHQQLGYTREEFSKLSIADIDPTESSQEVKDRIRNNLLKGGKAEFEVTHRTKRGEDRTVQVITHALTLSGRTVFHAIWRDVTDRKAAENRLKESEDRFRSIFENANDGIMIADAETKRHIDANRSICRMLGYTHDEIVGLHVDDIHPKDALPGIRNLFEKQLRGEIALVPDVPMLRKDGTVLYADINATHITVGGKHCLAGIFRDITERKRSDAALREREKQLAESQRIAHIGSWEHNLTTGKVIWSDELFRLMGLDPRKDPADFKMFFEMIHPDDRLALKNGIEETVKTGKQFSVDYRFNLPDGRTRIMLAQAELIHDETGTQNILSGTGQDITERKEAEDNLRQSEKFIRNMLDTVDEGFIVIDRDYRILTANKAYCLQMGGSDKDIIGHHCYEISHKISRPCFEEGEECATRQVFETGKPHSALHRHTDSDGNILYVETKAFPNKDSSGAITSVIETLNNITEKHLLEEERLKTQKLESIGTLAGGIAHDFNNLLQGIFGYISMAKMTIDQKGKSVAMLEQAEKALHQSVNLTTQLLTFSKGGKPIKKRMDLGPIIKNSAQFVLSGSRSDIRLKIPEDLWQAEVDGGQLGQVIQNIVLNADQAMPVGGTVKVTAANKSKDSATLPPGLAPGDYVMISIQDTGVGIPEPYLSKIFDPYFTTKEKGSGLGLATSYSITKNHGGMIDVKTQSGKGSTFIIYIPAITEKTRDEAEVRPAKSSLSRKAKVLVMDDEEMIRNLSSEMLRTIGHDVDVAKDGQEALEKYQSAMAAGKPFEIAILDLTIRGGMGGVETVQQLMKLDPLVKAIVSSGYADDIAIANYLSQGFKAFLNKPYDIDALREVISKMLGN